LKKSGNSIVIKTYSCSYIGCEKTARGASKNGHLAFNSGQRLSRPNENQTAFSIRRV
jgi:hypothetical protein